jgi:hypothetical protein
LKILDFRFWILKKLPPQRRPNPAIVPLRRIKMMAGLTRPPPTGGGANQNHKILSLSLERKRDRILGQTSKQQQKKIKSQSVFVENYAAIQVQR